MLTNCDWVVRPKRPDRPLRLRRGDPPQRLRGAVALASPTSDPDDLDAIGAGERPCPARPARRRPGHRPRRRRAHPRARQLDPGPRRRRPHRPRPDHRTRHGHLAAYRTGEGRISAETLLCGAGLVCAFIAASLRLKARRPDLADPADVTAAGLSGSDADRRRDDPPLRHLSRPLRRRPRPRLHRRAAASTSPVESPAEDRAGAEDRCLPRSLRRQGPASRDCSTRSRRRSSSSRRRARRNRAFARQPSRFSLDLTGRWWRG